MEREVLERWVEEGLSLEEMAQRVGRHASTVGYWLKAHQLEAPGRERHAPRGALPPDRLRPLVGQGLTVREIAGLVDRSPTTVRYWLRRHGLRTSPKPRSAAERAPRVEHRCQRHGETPHTIRPDGRLSCVRCRADAVTRWRQRAKRILVAEAGGRCACCGYDRCTAALQFHHLDPNEKRFGLGSRGLARSLDRLREEAAKCVLVCGNCHAEIEAGVRTLA